MIGPGPATETPQRTGESIKSWNYGRLRLRGYRSLENRQHAERREPSELPQGRFKPLQLRRQPSSLGLRHVNLAATVVFDDVDAGSPRTQTAPGKAIGEPRIEQFLAQSVAQNEPAKLRFAFLVKIAAVAVAAMWLEEGDALFFGYAALAFGLFDTPKPPVGLTRAIFAFSSRDAH